MSIFVLITVCFSTLWWLYDVLFVSENLKKAQVAAFLIIFAAHVVAIIFQSLSL